MTPDEAAAPALKKARRVVEDQDGKEQGPVELHACQEGENDYAEVVVVYEPEGTSLMMGGLHPRVCPAPSQPAQECITGCQKAWRMFSSFVVRVYVCVCLRLREYTFKASRCLRRCCCTS